MPKELLYDEKIEVRCCKRDKDAAQRVVSKLGCIDRSEAIRQMIRWIDQADDASISHVKATILHV